MRRRWRWIVDAAWDAAEVRSRHYALSLFHRLTGGVVMVEESMEKQMAMVLLEQGVTNLAQAMQAGSPRDYAKVLSRGILGMAEKYHESDLIDDAALRGYRKRISELTAGLWQ